MSHKSIIVANSAETFSPNTLRMRTPEAREWQTRYDQSLGERGLLWTGGDKLVVTSQPVSARLTDHITSALGYGNLVTASPENPTLYLCRDVWNEAALLEKLVAFAGSEPVDLIPYTTTSDSLELGDRLWDAGVRVEQPESVNARSLWLRDYLDTKGGFRILWQALRDRLHAFRLPLGFWCRSRQEASHAVCSFLDRGQPCIVKANLGAGGEGLTRFEPEAGVVKNVRDVLEVLQGNAYLDDDLLVVEEFIVMDRSLAGGSPSIDLFVPGPGQGEPYALCLSGQLLADDGQFLGVVMHSGLFSDSVASTIKHDGLEIAREAGRIGYVGPFDIDFVAGQDGNLYAVECNMRRTGGSHAHDAASFLFGPDYVQKTAVVATTKPLVHRQSLEFETLFSTLSDLFFSKSTSSGIILSNVSLLSYGSFGYLVFGRDAGQITEIQGQVLDRLQSLT